MAENTISTGFRSIGMRISGVYALPVPRLRRDNKWFAHFLEDCCETGEEYRESAGKLYDAYRAWCDRNKERTKRNSEFGHIVENAGYERKKEMTGNIYLGLRLKKAERTELTLFT